MRKTQHGHVLGMMILAAAAVSCVRGADAPEDRAAEHMKTDLAELKQASSQTDSTATLLAEVKPGATIDRPQLAQLLGDGVPAAAGESCPVLGQECAPRVFAATTACGGFNSDPCDRTGTQKGVWVDFACLNIAGNATCTAVVQDPTIVTNACIRVLDGTHRISSECFPDPATGEFVCCDTFCVVNLQSLSLACCHELCAVE
jgi:hypothetical protein